MSKRKFIIWDPKRGDVPRSSDGGYLTSGLIGVIEADDPVIHPWNVYLTAYPTFEEGSKRPEDLEVHESIAATYSLSQSKGVYQIIRIE